MMKSLVESVRGRLSGTNKTITEGVDGIVPVLEESSQRRLCAPSGDLCGITDIGLARDNNEDDFHLSSDGRGQLWIVADGMGGQAAGELASAIAIEAIVESMTTTTQTPSAEPDGSVPHRLRNAFALAQERVLCRSVAQQELKGMGSAALAAYLDGDILHVCHVGDVRCYVLSGGVLEQITRDHSAVAELVSEGVLTVEQARSHQDRGALNQAIGFPRGINPDINCQKLKRGDRVLICSDGLWESLTNDEITTVLVSEGTMRQLASVLANRAISAGGEDNITVILYEQG